MSFPVISVNFRDIPEIADLDEITSLQAPHRGADALLRDSIDEQGTPFRQTAVGKACTDARPNHATAMHQYCPTARTALAALGLAGVIYQRRNGYDLRSRSLLVASEPLTFELLSGDSADPLRFTVDDPATLLREAVDAATTQGFPWARLPLTLRPTPKLAHLIIESRKLTAAGAADDEAAG